MTAFSIAALSFALGALFGYRMRQQDAKAGTPSASHNTRSPKFLPIFDEALSLINRGEWAQAEAKLRELRQKLRASA